MNDLKEIERIRVYEKVITLLEKKLNSKLLFLSNEAICGYLSNKLSESENLKFTMMKHTLFKSWEYFSGDLLFPVPDPENKLDPIEKYMQTLFMWVGDYGRLRKDLCWHIMIELKQQTTY